MYTPMYAQVDAYRSRYITQPPNLLLSDFHDKIFDRSNYGRRSLIGLIILWQGKSMAEVAWSVMVLRMQHVAHLHLGMQRGSRAELKFQGLPLLVSSYRLGPALQGFHNFPGSTNKC